MNPAKSHKCMDFMTSVSESMETPMCGNTSPTCLTIYPSLHWWMAKFSVSMVGFHLPLTLWITSDPWIVFRKSLMRSVIIILTLLFKLI